MKMVLMVLVLAGLIFGYLGFFLVSTVSHDPDVWHVDPLDVERAASPNDYLIAPDDMTDQPHETAPIYEERAIIMAQAWDDFVLSQNDTVRIAGLPSELMMTYVQRTPTLKVPDYISVKFIALDENRTTIAVYSRSRFGYGDMGMNKRRVDAWMQTLAAFELPAES